MKVQKNKTETNSYSCPNCGGRTKYNPKTRKLTCLYCMSTFDAMSSNDVEEEDLYILLDKATPWQKTEVVQCENCGAREIVVKGQITSNCPFCGTSNIIKMEEIVGIVPHGLCPFVKSVDDAVNIAKKWVKGNFFTPNKFKKSAEAQSLHGVYTPAFVFDCDTTAKYEGKLGNTHTSTRRGSDGKSETYTYTTYFNVSGVHNKIFDDFVQHCSSAIPQNIMASLEPYNTREAVEYDEKYLAGFSANTYSKDGKTAWKDCQEDMKKVIKKEILSKYDHDFVSYLNTDVKFLHCKFKYLLLPVYVGHYTHKGKNYNFYVNGETGKIQGKVPVSWIKVLIIVLVGIFGIALPIVAGIIGFLLLK